MYKVLQGDKENGVFKPGNTTADKGKEWREIDKVSLQVSCNNA